MVQESLAIVVAESSRPAHAVSLSGRKWDVWSSDRDGRGISQGAAQFFSHHKAGINRNIVDYGLNHQLN